MRAQRSCGLASLVAAPLLVAVGCGGDNAGNNPGNEGGANSVAVGSDAGRGSDGGGGSDAGGAVSDGSKPESGALLDAKGDGDASAPSDSATTDHGAVDGGGNNDAAGDVSAPDGSQGSDGGASHAIKTVFLILMENHDWSLIKGSASAPYINNTLLPSASYAEQYYNPPGNHPSLPNYLWLESGQNFGILNDNPPSSNQQTSTMHLATLMANSGVTWRAYEEDISGSGCPLTNTGNYAVRHDPFVYFEDITMGAGATCAQNVRPYTQLASDLSANSVAQYNFITPNVCDDMHDDKSTNSTCASTDSIKDGDTWLSTEVPKIQASPAFQNGGAIFITWDEGETLPDGGGTDGPIGMIVLSPLAKGGGYSNTIHYTHSSTLRTMQVVFDISPFLGDATNATDLGDLFSTFP